MKQHGVKPFAQKRIHKLRRIRRSPRTKRHSHEFQGQQHLPAQRKNPATETAQNGHATVAANLGSGQTTELDCLRVREASHTALVLHGVKKVFAERVAP